MTVIQLPFRNRPIGNIKTLAELPAVHSGHFPQLSDLGLTIHRNLSINAKNTLRNHYSRTSIVTQRVNYKYFYAAVEYRIVLCILVDFS